MIQHINVATDIPDDLEKAYEAFFFKSESGKYFLNEIKRLIIDEHKAAEDDPELSRDHTQRAKGIRLVQNHIDSVIGGVKK